MRCRASLLPCAAALVVLALVVGTLTADAQLTWSKVTVNGANIPGRINAGMGYDPTQNILIVFGGSGGSGILDDTWTFDLAAGTWTERNTAPANPRPQRRFSLVADVHRPSNQFLVSTGEGPNDVFFNDVWGFDLTTFTWSLISNPNAASQPEVRYGAGGGVFPDGNAQALYVTHGFATERFDDTWRFDLSSNTWSNVSPSRSDRPTGRCLHTASMTATDKMIMFGGCGSGGYGACPTPETWLFDDTANTWTELDKCPRQVIYPTSSLYGSNYFLMYGGRSGTGFGGTDTSGTVSVLSLSDNKWRRVQPAGDPPSDPVSCTSTFVDNNGPDAVYVLCGSELFRLTGDPLLNDQLDCNDRFDLRILHGVFMALSWGILLPIGATIARYFKHIGDPNLVPLLWFQLHRGIQMTGLTIAVGGLIVATLMTAAGGFSTPHAFIGLFVMVLGLSQPLNALFRHRPKGTRRRRIWEEIHWWTGRVALLLGITNVIYGLALIRAHVAIIVLYVLWVVVLACFYFYKEIGAYLQNKRRKPEAVPQSDPNA